MSKRFPKLFGRKPKSDASAAQTQIAPAQFARGWQALIVVPEDKPLEPQLNVLTNNVNVGDLARVLLQLRDMLIETNVRAVLQQQAQANQPGSSQPDGATAKP